MEVGLADRPVGEFAICLRRDPEWRPLMQFSRLPVTEDAQRLVDEICADIIANEQRQRQRRAYDLAAFKNTLGRALGDLAVTLSIDEHHCRSWPRGKYYYGRGSLVSWRHSIAVSDGLERIGLLVTEVRGYYNRETGEGLCAQVRPTEALRERMKNSRLLDEVDLHWRFDRAALEAGALVPLVLVRQKRKQIDWRKPPIDLIPGMELTKEGRRLTEQMEERNEFIKAQAITGPELLGWYRVFNGGSFEHGGRMYALPRGEPSYQQWPEEQRIALRVNGMPVNEIDIKASHLYFALARKRVDLVERMKQLNIADPYSIADAIPRKLLKSYVTAMFGQERHPARWPKRTAQKFDFRLPTVASVRDKLLRAYPELLDLAGIGWSYLQKVESEALGAAMDHLRAEGVPSLPVHDSLIVPQEATALAVVFLRRACAERAGFAPPAPEINRVQNGD